MTRFQNNRHFFPARFYFRYHALVLAITVCLLLSIEWALGARWSLFWPLIIWGLMVSIHYFVSAAFDINEVWADDRVVDVKTRSYDLGHIMNIEHRIGGTHDSITPHTERE
jgi:hypothetical protein|tara:strand:+ start:150 stop:482 length:333 start_codon:yes stop_codon:yes gene_type:complete